MPRKKVAALLGVSASRVSQILWMVESKKLGERERTSMALCNVKQ